MGRKHKQHAKPDRLLEQRSPVSRGSRFVRRCYQVRVYLGALAENLNLYYNRHPTRLFDAASAAHWLVAPSDVVDPYTGKAEREPSPFRRTTEPGVFYCEEDPTAFLEETERGASWPAPYTYARVAAFHPPFKPLPRPKRSRRRAGG